jgi:hypothetical protein
MCDELAGSDRSGHDPMCLVKSETSFLLDTVRMNKLTNYVLVNIRPL